MICEHRAAQIATGLVLAAWFGCARAPRVPAVTQIDRLTLERTQCRGTCPAYTVTVSGDGRVAFEGRSDVRFAGTTTWTLPRGKVGELADVLNAAGFLAFRDRYEGREDGCPLACTDSPTVIVTLRHGGGQKTVRHYHGCRGIPKPPFQRTTTRSAPPPWGPPLEYSPDRDYAFPYVLTALEDRIDEILGTAEWVGHRQSNIPASILPAGRK